MAEHLDTYEPGKMDISEHLATWRAFSKISHIALVVIAVSLALMGAFLIHAAIGGILVFGVFLSLVMYFLS